MILARLEALQFSLAFDAVNEAQRLAVDVLTPSALSRGLIFDAVIAAQSLSVDVLTPAAPSRGTVFHAVCSSEVGHGCVDTCNWIARHGFNAVDAAQRLSRMCSYL